MYKALAFNMRNQKIRFGLIHAGVSEIIERFNIPKYPFVLSIFGPVAGGDPGALQVQYLKRAGKESEERRLSDALELNSQCFFLVLTFPTLVRATRSYLIPGR